ncbi:MAG: trigger factor [Limnochordia bacterium]
MKATAERLENNKVALDIEVDAEEVDAALERAYRKVVQRVTIPGFRKGKAPRKVVEARLGKEVLYDEALEELVPAAYREALDQEQLDPIERPTISQVEIEEGKPLRFRAEVTVAPEVTLGEYKGIRVEKLVERVEEKDIAHILEHLQEDHAELVPAERTRVEKGDYAVIDFEGFIDGQPFDGGAAKGYRLQIGSNRLIEGFEEQLVGAEVGVPTEVRVTFPEDYHAEHLRGKEAVFQVTVTSLHVKRLPELDDEFARDVGGVETLDQLKEEIRKDMEAAAERRAENAMRERLVQLVRDQSQVELPEVLVEEELVDLINDFARDLARLGISLQQYLERSGKTPDDLRAEFRPEAEARVKTELVLKAIARREGITVSREELEAKIDQLVAGERDPKAARQLLDDPDRRAAIKTSMVLDKTVQFLVDHAEIEVKEIPSQGHGHVHHHDHEEAGGEEEAAAAGGGPASQEPAGEEAGAPDE